jgi:hypothetical protein
MIARPPRAASRGAGAESAGSEAEGAISAGPGDGSRRSGQPQQPSPTLSFALVVQGADAVRRRGRPVE